jgi:hypothetical protein
VELVRKAAEENYDFFKSLGVKKVNELAATSNKLTNHFTGTATSGLGPGVDRELPVAPH